MDQLGGILSGSTSDKKMNAVSVGRETSHEAKKTHRDLAFAVLKAGDQLESEGKLQLTWGNSK